MADSLKPCPFCGEPGAEVRHSMPDGSDLETGFCGCNACGVYFDSTEGWNRRAPAMEIVSTGTSSTTIFPPKGTVEDSHAALAKEMRRVAARKRDEGAPLDISLPENEWAARVEQLGAAHEQAKAFHGHEYENRVKLEAEREAREAEIAKVRAILIDGCARRSHRMPDSDECFTFRQPGCLCALAARLGGAT